MTGRRFSGKNVRQKKAGADAPAQTTLQTIPRLTTTYSSKRAQLRLVPEPSYCISVAASSIPCGRRAGRLHRIGISSLDFSNPFAVAIRPALDQYHLVWCQERIQCPV